MKLQLSSTLPFTPVQLDCRHSAPQRAVGQLHGLDGAREYRTAVYAFRHDENDHIDYQIDPEERVYLDQLPDSVATTDCACTASSEARLQWVEHDDSLTYKPYAFLVMNAMTRLVGEWDGVVYQTPSGERLGESVWNATLQVVDACVCNRIGLWVMVQLAGEKGMPEDQDLAATHPLGWVPLLATGSR
ncbi:MAG: hypothetical protein HKN42_17335 [Granulosicoccus sp.]|nr:hypothetical protein [Granulosicoccus sp.]